MNSRNIFITVLAVALIAGGVFYLTRGPGETAFDIEALLAEDVLAGLYNKENTLIINDGNATIKRADGTEEMVFDSTNVGVNDTIRVNANSVATLNWFDGSVSRLQAGTKLTITKADYNPENVAETDINFKVISGEVWSKVINLIDEDSEFLSYGGTVVAGVRGSAFNFVVANGTVEVESLEHTAFVAEVDPDTNEVIEDSETIVVSGEQAIITDKVVVEDIPEEKLERRWIKDNTVRDVKVSERIQKRNLKRIQQLAGPLPGQPGYKAKQEAIQNHLDAIEDPNQRAQAEARVAKLHAREVVAAALSGGAVADVAIQIQQAKAQIEASDLSDATKAKIQRQLQSEVKVIDRALDSVLADNENLYEVKEALREQRVELEDNAEAKQRIQEKIAERRLYELDDLVKKKGVKEEIIERHLERLDKDFENLKDRLEDRPNLRRIKGFYFDRSICYYKVKSRPSNSRNYGSTIA